MSNRQYWKWMSIQLPIFFRKSGITAFTLHPKPRKRLRYDTITLTTLDQDNEMIKSIGSSMEWRLHWWSYAFYRRYFNETTSEWMYKTYAERLVINFYFTNKIVSSHHRVRLYFLLLCASVCGIDPRPKCIFIRAPCHKCDCSAPLKVMHHAPSIRQRVSRYDNRNLEGTPRSSRRSK